MSLTISGDSPNFSAATITTGTVTTLTTTTISDGTNSTSATNPIRGSARAWVQWGLTGTIASSYNVSSVTRNSAGQFTVNFTTAFANTNYSAQYNCNNGARYVWFDTFTTTSLNTYSYSAGAGYNDCPLNCVVVFSS